jgi:y4mF family transcriptional regulator
MQKRIVLLILLFLHVNAYNMNKLSDFVKTRRKQLGLTQAVFAEKAGVALTVIRKIEQGKGNLSLSKVNQVLQLFGHVLGPINEKDATGNR